MLTAPEGESPQAESPGLAHNRILLRTGISICRHHFAGRRRASPHKGAGRGVASYERQRAGETVNGEPNELCVLSDVAAGRSNGPKWYFGKGTGRPLAGRRLVDEQIQPVLLAANFYERAPEGDFPQWLACCERSGQSTKLSRQRKSPRPKLKETDANRRNQEEYLDSAVETCGHIEANSCHRQ